ncbi:MAG: hypothetical protein WCW35_06870 [Bacteroidota bacterium]
MGSSKVIMLSGVYLMLGMYNVSFYQADRLNSTAVEAVANAVQAEQLARTGISIAVTTMADDVSKNTLGQQTVSFTNGTITYQAWILSGTQSKVTSTGTFNGKTVTMKAVVSFERNRWRVLRSYVIPSPDTVS